MPTSRIGCRCGTQTERLASLGVRPSSSSSSSSSSRNELEVVQARTTLSWWEAGRCLDSLQRRAWCVAIQTLAEFDSLQLSLCLHQSSLK